MRLNKCLSTVFNFRSCEPTRDQKKILTSIIKLMNSPFNLNEFPITVDSQIYSNITAGIETSYVKHITTSVDRQNSNFLQNSEGLTQLYTHTYKPNPSNKQGAALYYRISLQNRHNDPHADADSHSTCITRPAPSPDPSWYTYPAMEYSTIITIAYSDRWADFGNGDLRVLFGGAIWLILIEWVIVVASVFAVVWTFYQ